jgi:hypothetical protein
MSESPVDLPGNQTGPISQSINDSFFGNNLEPQNSPEPIFKLLLTLIYPSKCVRTSSRKTKSTKPDSDNKGPFDVSVEIGWHGFLGIIATKLDTVPLNLRIKTFEWRWLKPANSLWLPIQDENGFISMMKKVKAKKTEPYVILHMDAPPPSAQTPGNSSTVIDDSESDLDDNSLVKKVCIHLTDLHFGVQDFIAKAR